MTFGEKYQPETIIRVLTKAGIGILAALFLSVIVSRLVYPFCLGAWEAFNWMPAEHLLSGENPYSFAFREPYGMSPYGIVYYALIAVGIKFFGYQLWFGRLLSAAAFAVCGLAVFKITQIVTSRGEAARIAVLALLAMFPGQIWIAVMRCDLIAAAFSMAALWAVLTIKEKVKTPVAQIVLIAGLCAAAFFTKSTFILLTGIAFLRFVQLKSWRGAVLFAVSTALLVGAGIFLLDYTSNGGYLWQHLTHAEALPFDFDRAVNVFVGMLKTPSFTVSLFLAAYYIFQNRKIFFHLRRGKVLKIVCSPKFLIIFCCALSTVWSFASAGRIGGNANYYIENSFMLAVTVGIIYDFFRRNKQTFWAMAAICLLTAGGSFQLCRVARGEYFRWQSLAYYREVFQEIGKVTAPNSRCVSVYAEMVVWNGCRLNFDDFEEYYNGWSPELGEIFNREVSNGSYAAILWYDDEFAARFPNYRLVQMSEPLPEKFYPVYLYVRKDQ